MSDKDDQPELIWAQEATRLLEELPPFTQEMARHAIEDRTRELGLEEVTGEIAQETIQHLGLTKSTESHQAEGVPEATLVILKKVKKMAPSFHKHIAEAKMRGTTVSKGDKILVYEIEATTPEGSVQVTEKTRLEFK